MEGITQAKAQAESDEDRERLEKARKQLAAYFAAQGQMPPQVPGQAPPTPEEQAMQMSMAPGQPGASMGGATAPPPPANRYTPAYASLPGGADMQRQQQRMAWEDIINR